MGVITAPDLRQVQPYTVALISCCSPSDARERAWLRLRARAGLAFFGLLVCCKSRQSARAVLVLLVVQAVASLGAKISDADLAVLVNGFGKGDASAIDFHILHSAISSMIWK